MGRWGEGWKETRSPGPLAVQAQAPAERRDLSWGSGEGSRQVLLPEGPRFRRGLRGGKTASGARIRVSDTNSAPSEGSKGHSRIQDQFFPSSSGEESAFGSSLALWGLRAHRAPDGGLGTRPNTPSPFPLPSQESSGSLRLGLGLGIPRPRAWQQRRLLASVGNFTKRRPFPPSGASRSPQPFKERQLVLPPGRSGAYP